MAEKSSGGGVAGFVLARLVLARRCVDVHPAINGVSSPPVSPAPSPPQWQCSGGRPLAGMDAPIHSPPGSWIVAVGTSPVVEWGADDDPLIDYVNRRATRIAQEKRNKQTGAMVIKIK
jgi:hypothetical protein